MNTKQEIVDAFDGCYKGELPPPAVFTQTGTVGQMDDAASWPDANFDPIQMAELSLRLADRFGFASVRVPFCLTAEVERLGATINPGRTETQPSVVTSPFRTPEGFDMPPGDLMSPEEMVSGGRCAMIAEVADSIRRKREDLFVTAGMQGGPGLAMLLLGAENLLMGYLLERDKTVAWVKALVPHSCAYAKLLSESADNVLVIGSGSMDLCDPVMYEDMIRPNQGATIASIRSSYSTIHLCGDTTMALEGLIETGTDALVLEASRDPEYFVSRVAGRAKLFGAVDPIKTLYMGTPADVASQARQDAEFGFDIIVPECGVPPMTPDDNLRALAHYREM